MIYEITTIEQLKDFTKEFQKSLQKDDIVGLKGDLGAGKTTFVKLLMKELGVVENVISPTYIYEQVYVLPKEYNQIKTIHHLDLYRISDDKDLDSLGLNDHNGDLMLIEWIEKSQDLSDRATKSLNFYLKDNQRFVESFTLSSLTGSPKDAPDRGSIK